MLSIVDGGGGGCGDCVWEELCPTHIILPRCCLHPELHCKVHK